MCRSPCPETSKHSEHQQRVQLEFHLVHLAESYRGFTNARIDGPFLSTQTAIDNRTPIVSNVNTELLHYGAGFPGANLCNANYSQPREVIPSAPIPSFDLPLFQTLLNGKFLLLLFVED